MKCNIHTEVEAIGTCVDCGKMICEGCKTEVNEKYYCGKCVEKRFEETEKKETVIVNTIHNSTKERVRVPKNKVAAGLFGIFLGGLGIHKFYLGKVGMGILYLLLCWTYIPAIIGFIEGIVYFCMDDKKFSDKYDNFR